MKKYFVVAFICALGFAINMGKIKGAITDDQGEPLIGVNIIIEGTELGAASDETGEYLVHYIPAGTYRVTASYIGYYTMTKENVLVYTDQTTVINFRLEPEVIPMQTVVVSAQRDLVIKTQTQTQRTITAQDIDMLPISDINQIITLQAGVSESELGTHIRGGRATEIAYFVDGILTKAPHYGQQSVNLNKQAVEEVAITTGGFDAEYGEALSGVVNIVTREGPEKFAGLMRYTTDEVFPQDKMNYGYNLYELSLGGGLLDKRRMRYFFSGEAMLTDAYQNAHYKVPSERFDYKVEGKLSYRLPSAKGKILVTGFYSREQYMSYRDIWGDLSFIYNLDHNYGVRQKNYLSTVTFNYMPSERMIIESKLGITDYNRFRAVRDLEAEAAADRQWYEDYIFNGEAIPAILANTDIDTMKKHLLIDTLMTIYELLDRSTAASLRNNPFASTGFFYTVGDQRYWRYEFNRDYQGVLSLTSSIGKVHEFKSGIALTKQYVGWYDNNLPFFVNPFWDFYEKDPLRFALFLQDRMDFEGIIARLGLRFDYFDSKAGGLINPADRSDSTIITADPKWRLSPRLGFSMPITDRSKLRFNYGHFFQTPTSHHLYRSTEPIVIWNQRMNNVIGNPNLTVEKTVSYELGYENQLSDVFAFGFIAYYKDIYDLIQTREVVALPYPYYQVFNVDYGNVKGIEFTLQRRLYDYWKFTLSYTLQFAKGTASDAWQHYYDVYMDEDYDIPRIDYWLNFDERHIVNSNIGFSFPETFAFSPLQDFFMDFIVSYHSGFPYTPEDDKGQPLGDQNSARITGYVNVDANISKDIKIMGFKLNVFGQIFNLLNTDQINTVYSQTGLPGDNGGLASVQVQDFRAISLTSAYYSPQGDYDHDGLNSPKELYLDYIQAYTAYYNNPFNWKPGFRARVGVGIRF